MAIKELSQNVEIHQTLGDNPNTDGEGMSAEELKRAFDEPARIIKDYINEEIVKNVLTKGDPITGLKDPANETDAATKGYVDSYVDGRALLRSGGEMEGSLTTRGIFLTPNVDFFNAKPSSVPANKLIFVKAGG